MSELKDALERRSDLFDLEPGALDRFFRRRERRERRRRVAAICLALGVTAAGALLTVRALSSDEPVLGENGVLDLTAPAGFVEGRSPSGITFRISGDVFTTNAFVNVACSNTVGRYRWRLSGTELSFEPIVDPCGVRRTLFASEAWSRQG